MSGAANYAVAVTLHWGGLGVPVPQQRSTWLSRRGAGLSLVSV